MSSGCGDVLSLEDLKTAKKHQTFESEVITGRAGGVSSGAEIDFATNQVTGQVQKTMPAILRDLGFNPADFDFTSGGYLSTQDRDKAVFDPATSTWFSWRGVLPKIVSAGENPILDSQWAPVSDPNIRSDLLSHNEGVMVSPEKITVTSAEYSGVPEAATLVDYMTDVNPRMWKHLVISGSSSEYDDWSYAIQAAINFSIESKKRFVNNITGGISKTIVLPSYAYLHFIPGTAWVALPGFSGDMVKSENAPEGDYLTVVDVAAECKAITIENMTLFGGWVSDTLTPSYVGIRDGLRLFGVQHSIDNIKIMNVRDKSYNIGGRFTTDIKGMAPSDFTRLRSDWSGQEAFIFGGSSDSHASFIKVRDAGQLSNAVYTAIKIGPYGTLRADKFHVWNSSTALRHECCIDILAYDTLLSNSHFEGAQNCQVRITGSRNQVSNTEVYNQWASGGGMVEILGSSNKFHGRAFISSAILPLVSVYAVVIGASGGTPVNFTNVDIDAYNTKLGFFNLINHAGYLKGDASGDTTNYSASQNRSLVITGSLVDGKDSITFDTPQYRSVISAGSVISSIGVNAVNDINTSTGNLLAQGAVLRNVTTAVPTLSGTVYKTSAGVLMIKE